MAKDIGDKLKEYGFIFASGLAGIIFATTVLLNEPGNAFDYLVIPSGVVIGNIAGRKIRRSMGKPASDERDIQNYESGMSWGFITFAVLTAVQASTALNIAVTEILMWSVGVAFTVTLYAEISQSGLKGLMAR
ncbi:hypothetical protein [Candidatus Nanohalobium constans]|uniref:Uncharacterized protein n=1 Tax=Candidatus Nanohalobium constans TaxID=2565781 RepID=A0A5Q0UG19_9ARCH|nr:hypothetical protein [Candidatus Nanohalobium constans]QGA80593.1 hypothetical protein LC1Nh_0704 [Candidatus Nanohalobium constans]